MDQTLVNGQEAIHAVLDYVVSKALLQGKVGQSQVYVQLTDLIKYGDIPNELKSNPNFVLKVLVKTEWVTQEEFSGVTDEFEGVEDEEDGLD